jgi:hypothetical protein
MGMGYGMQGVMPGTPASIPLPGTGTGTGTGITRGGGSKKIVNIRSDRLIKKIKTFNKKYAKFLV